MESETSAPNKKGIFFDNLPPGFEIPEGPVELRLLHEYGSVFAARNGVIAPKTVVFRDDGQVSDFQSGLETKTRRIGDFDIELQAAAMDALAAAASEATEAGLSISARCDDSGKRAYEETVVLWKSRVEPALDHWVANGRMTPAEAAELRSLTPYEQVPEIFRLEADGVFFAKDLSKSIIYSVAPPGTSQHLSLLAFDAVEHADERVRSILARRGWYQTVTSDLPHFTFLGTAEKELSGIGLKCVQNGGREFWVPNI